jgi:Tol biopolymer transport system component
MTRSLTLTLALAATLLAAGTADAKQRNGRIFYGALSDLSSIRPDGTDRHVLPRQWDEIDIAASPDGRRLVVAGTQELEIWDSSTGEQVDDVPLPGRTWIGAASWAPSGRELVFQSCDKTEFTDIEECVRYGIYRVRPDGSGLKRLVAGGNPSWSPDGRSLTLVRNVRPFDRNGNECPGIYTVRRDGTRLRRVLPRRRNCSFDGGPLFFAGAGNRIVYTTEGGRGGLWSMRVNGTGIRRLVRMPRGAALSHAALSPDGRRIVYTARRGMYVTGAARGGRGRRVATLSYTTNALTWAPLASR